MEQTIDKYEFTSKTILYRGRVLHRIKALKDFGDVRAGDLGGFIEKQENLSHKGICWVSSNAYVYGKAKVCGNAQILNNAQISGKAEVFGNAKVNDSARVYGNAQVFGDACVCGNAQIFGKAEVYGRTVVCDNAMVYDKARVFEGALVSGLAQISGEAIVYNKAWVNGFVKAYGNTRIHGAANISGNARVYQLSDYIVFKNWWSSGRYFTWTRSNNMWKAGCFYGTGEELIKKAYEDSEISGREYERVVRYVESTLADERERKRINKNFKQEQS